MSLHLTTTSHKVQIVTGQAVPVDVDASWTDLSSAGVVTPGNLISKITTNTTTDVIPAPAASTTRKLKALFVANVHASSSVTVTIQHTDGTNIAQIESVTLLAGERIAIREGLPTRVVDANGMEKVNASASVFAKVLASDQSNSTVTPTNVTGLEVPCGVGTWIFEYFLLMRSVATTTGHRLSVNHDGTVGSFVAIVSWPTALGTASAADADQDILTAAGGLQSIFAARAKSTAGWGTTLSVDTADADVLYTIQGIVVVTVAGNIELWHGSEVAAQSTIKGGSSLRLTKVG